MFDRPVILIGHSLGGRIVLKTSQHAKVKQCFANLCILLQRFWKLSAIFQQSVATTRSQPVVFYSEKGSAFFVSVGEWYRLGERTKTLSLGYAGIKEKNNQGLVHSFNVSKWHGKDGAQRLHLQVASSSCPMKPSGRIGRMEMTGI